MRASRSLFGENCFLPRCRNVEQCQDWMSLSSGPIAAQAKAEVDVQSIDTLSSVCMHTQVNKTAQLASKASRSFHRGFGYTCLH